MKNGDKNPGLSLWELWKDTLALSAAILTFFAVLDVALAYFCGYEHHVQSVVSQLGLWLPLSIFAPIAVLFVSACVAQRLAIRCTERRRRKVGLVLAIVAFLGTVIWVIAMEKWSPQGMWMWIIALVLLVLVSAGWSMFLQRQREERPSKAQERDEVPSTPKRQRAKITDLAALLVLLLTIALTRKKPK
ncbi:MAG: hypothetical protein ISS52_00590 [Dehalococcoidia bacterium]|nr:hypothetical protein [Dehalococcoidia bacterium]